MKRREFIRLGGFLTVSAAAIGMTGCDPVGDSSDTSASALDPTLYPTPTRPMPAAASGAGWSFPQSVASADPKADSIVLWARVIENTAAATDVATTDVAITLTVTAADNSGNLGTNNALSGTAVATVTVPAYADYDGTVRHKLTGLSADTTYYYQFQAGTVLSKVGRFKTAPAASATRDVKFAFVACQDWSTNHWGVFQDIVARDATDNLDFIVHLGDYIYETDNGGVAGQESGHAAIVFPDGTAVPPAKAGDPAPGGNYATTTNDYRHLYKLYRSDARLQAVHERFPIIAVWDDHEFSDDAWQSAETYTNQNNGQVSRRRDANQAWFEFMPADVTFQETNPSFQNIQLYRDFKFGATMHLVMTDERLYKQDHLIPETTLSPLSGQQLGRINSRYLAPEGSMKIAENLKNAASPNLTLLTMLGATQREWWKSKMSSATSTWKVWGNEVSLLRMGLNGTKAVGTLIAMQTLQGTGPTMTASLSDPNVQAIPKAAAGAGAAIGAGATSAVAIPASFAMLTAYSTAYASWLAANPGDTAGAATAGQSAAMTAGTGAGLTAPQAGAALSAIGSKNPTAAEIGICAVTVVAATQMYMTARIAKATASQLAAGATVGAILTDAALGGAATAPALLPALKGANPAGGYILDDTAGTVVVTAYLAARGYAGSGTTAQVTYGAGAFATTGGTATALPTSVLRIRAEVETATTTVVPLATNSAYVNASGMLASLAPFFRKFLINADQWDGYAKERNQLMSYLADNNIDNVVAVTGDIHAFFAGTVHSEFPGEILTTDASGNEVTSSAGTSAVMVDLVTAGVSSTSWYNYLNAAAAALSASLTTLVSQTLTSAQTGLPFNLKLPVLDFSLGKEFSSDAVKLMLADAIRDGAAAAGVPESMLPKSATDIATDIFNAPASASLVLLCQALATMGREVNPWLEHVDSNAQGYSVVTASHPSNSGTLVCKFRHVNAAFYVSAMSTSFAPGVIGADQVFGGGARPVVSREVTATVTAGAADVVIS